MHLVKQMRKWHSMKIKNRREMSELQGIEGNIFIFCTLALWAWRGIHIACLGFQSHIQRQKFVFPVRWWFRRPEDCMPKTWKEWIIPSPVKQLDLSQHCPFRCSTTVLKLCTNQERIIRFFPKQMWSSALTDVCENSAQVAQHTLVANIMNLIFMEIYIIIEKFVSVFA